VKRFSSINALKNLNHNHYTKKAIPAHALEKEEASEGLECGSRGRPSMKP
jgi:hypothetical protein